MTSSKHLTICLSVLALFAFGGETATAALQEQQVLLVWNSQNTTSTAIKNAYLAKHPNVKNFDLNLPYSVSPPSPSILVSNPACADCTGAPCEYGTNCHFESDCCSCQYLFTAPYMDTAQITPDLFEESVRKPLSEFLSLPANSGVLAIATTKGLPAIIATGWPVAYNHAAYCVKGSFEASLASLGFEPDPNNPWNPYTAPNSYYGRVGVSFQSWINSPNNDCYYGGAPLAGKMFLVSRLDSANLNQGDSNCPPDPNQQCDNLENYINDVCALINRSANLTVNKRAVTIVIDIGAPCTMSAGVAGYMARRGWCVYYDNTQSFLHGANHPSGTCGILDPNVEGRYIAYPELVHYTLGRNHGAFCGGVNEEVCVNYASEYKAHPAGFFQSHESYNGFTVRNPCFYAPDWGHGNVLDWIGSGGSFAIAHAHGPGSLANQDFIIANLYEHGLSWGEAAYSGILSLGSILTPIGDPLARVTVYDPDINRDGIVNAADLAIVLANWGPCPPHIRCPADIDRDGVVDIQDQKLVEEALDRVCDYPQAPNVSWPPPPFTLPAPSQWAQCYGDIIGDMVVDCNDAYAIINHYGVCPPYDLNGDGVVNDNDLFIVQANWGRCILDVNDDYLINSDDLLAVMDAWCNPSNECDCRTSPHSNSRADIDCDCDVDEDDYQIVLSGINHSAECGEICE